MIRADIFGTTIEEVAALCRSCIANGHDPSEPLDAFLRRELALRVRSIGDMATLVPLPDGSYRRRGAQKALGSPLVSQTAPEATGGAPDPPDAPAVAPPLLAGPSSGEGGS
jgi:hypothetical protein